MFFSTSHLSAQTFTVSSSTWSPFDLAEGEVIFANVDGDAANVSEIFVAGRRTSGPSTYTEIFRRVGNNYISNLSNLAQLRDVSADFGDFNRDGNLDLAMCGLDASNIRQVLIYQGNGNSTGTYGTSTAPIVLSGAGVDEGSLAWGDYDNDGDLDLALMGESNSGLIARIYENDNNSFIQDFTLNLTTMKNGELAWGDYDADGDLDLIMTGMSGTSLNTPTSRLFQNTGNGGLVFRPVPNLQDLGGGSVQWGDYDNDGDLDILISGESGTGLVTEVLENRGNSDFQPITSTFTGIIDGEARWIDYNTDGYLDIILAGKSGPNQNTDRVLELYQNNAGASFSLVPVTAFVGVDEGAAIGIGDLDGDRKLDLAVLGRTGPPDTYSRILYENQDNGTNLAAASQPLNVTATSAGASLIIDWDAPAGYPANLVNGLSYNLFIGTTLTNQDIEAAMGNTVNGDRYIYEKGNIQATEWRIRGLDAGTYSIHVQAVDQDWEGGAWSGVITVPFTPPISTVSVFEDRTTLAFNPANSQEGVRDGDVSWADFNGDETLDLLIVGGNAASQNNGVVQVWQNNNNLNFTQTQTGLNANLDLSDAAWGDYDNDGDADLLVIGQFASFGVSRLFRNDGGNLIEETTLSSQIVGAFSGSVDWGDYDNDGDLDILITGRGYDGPVFQGSITRLYRNDYNPATGIRSFVEDTNAASGLPGLSFTGAELGEGMFGDFDQDGWLDFLVVGQDVGPVAPKLYQNNGDGTFSDFSQTFLSFGQAAAAFGDINNDGFLDIALMGTVSGAPSAQIYQYVPLPPPFPSSYTQAGSLPLEARLENGDIEFGDYNDDGFSDLIISGTDLDDSARTIVLINSADGLGNFSQDFKASEDLARVSNSSIAWADFDGDNKLDLALAGALNGSTTYITRLYRNKNTNPNTIPGAPSNLSQRLSGFDVEFSWDPPAGYPTNAVEGLTYAIYIDTTGGPGGVDVRSPMSNVATGNRQIVHIGELNSTNFTLKGLRTGTYCWSVQAIDQDYESSLFAPTQCFTYELPTFIDQTDNLFTALPPDLLNEASVAWGDYTGDGNLDIAVCGTDASGNPATELYEFDNGAFVKGGANSDAIIDVKNGSVDWGDYDNDGDLDLLITGDAVSGGLVSRIFNNIGGGFIASDTLQFEGLFKSAGEFADINNDGRLDFVISGERSNGADATFLYVQNSLGNFVRSSITPGLSDASLDWGDYNNDGYLDLLIAGTTGSAGDAFLYRNDQNGGFTEVAAGLAETVQGDLEFGDFTGDGFLDIVQIGETSGGTRFARILENNRNDTFGPLTSTDALSSGAIILGDYNNDGYKDVLVAGQNGGSVNSRAAKLYRFNPINKTFEFQTFASSTFEAVGSNADAAWGD
ncbi:MAG: FG-GAP-like repeat-containing protein, partial [Bacteroidota bacterium]